MKFFRRGGERGRTSDANDNPGAGPSDTSFLRRLFTSHDTMIPLAEVEQAIDQGLRHNPQNYDSSRDRYKTLRNDVEKVIKGFCKQRGQELLREQGIRRETHIIPNTAHLLPRRGNAEQPRDMTLNQMTDFLEEDIGGNAEQPRAMTLNQMIEFLGEDIGGNAEQPRDMTLNQMTDFLGEDMAGSSQKSGAHPLVNPGQEPHGESSSANLPQNIEMIRGNAEQPRAMTLNQMIDFLEEDIALIKDIKMYINGDNPYNHPRIIRKIRHFESLARPFLTEMGNIYERHYGRHPTILPEYPPPEYQASSEENQPGPSSHPS